MPELLLPLLIPLVWARCRSRRNASLSVLALYLAGAREEPFAVARVLPSWDLWGGCTVWICHAVTLSLPWVLAWVPHASSFRHRGAALLVVLGTLALPPLGLWGWLHPFTLGGWLFPGWGPWGLVALTVMLLAMIPGAARGLLLTAPLSLLANLSYQPPPGPAGWLAIDTALPRLQADAGSRFRRQEQLMAVLHPFLAASQGKAPAPRVLVLPEEVAGPWTEAEAWWWQPALEALRTQGTTLLLGAQHPEAAGLRNGAWLFAPDSTSWQLARQPVPLADWRPWSGPPAGWLADRRAAFLNDGMVRVDGQRVLLSFCFEDLLTLPVLITMGLAPRPDVLVSLANQWWAEALHEPEVQRRTVEGWARLWGVPLVRAVNRPG